MNLGRFAFYKILWYNIYIKDKGHYYVKTFENGLINGGCLKLAEGGECGRLTKP